MAISASAIYGLYKFISVLCQDTLAEWVNETFRLRHLAVSFLTDIDLFSSHLWYFWAIVYDLIFLRLLDKFGLSRYLSYIVPILLLTFIVFNFTPYYNWLTRNWLFMGLPCMCVGRWIREDDKKWLKVFSSSHNCIAIAIISFVLVCIEFYIGSVVLNYPPREMYIFTLPLIVSVFCIALRHPEFGKGTFLAEIGRRYSAVIYIIHILIIAFLSLMLSNEGYLTYTFFPIAVFAISLLVAMLWERLKTVVVQSINEGTRKVAS